MSQITDATHVTPVPRRRAEHDLRGRARQDLSVSDEDLLRRVARGDGDALAIVHHRWGGLVHANVRRILRDPALAEQVTEQILADLSTTANRFDPTRADPGTWLLTVAHERATAWAASYPEAPRSEAASEPPTTSWATRFSFRLLWRA